MRENRPSSPANTIAKHQARAFSILYGHLCLDPDFKEERKALKKVWERKTPLK